MEDAAELERLSKERKLDKTHQDRIIRIVGDENSSERLIEEKCDSPISTKKQVLSLRRTISVSLILLVFSRAYKRILVLRLL